MQKSSIKPTKFYANSFVPLLLFLVLAGGLGVALFSGDPSKIPSALLNKPVPAFELKGVAGLKKGEQPFPGLNHQDLKKGQVSILNVFQSSCLPCREEHPILTAFAKEAGVSLFGLNYKDQPADAIRFLKQLGNPYVAIGEDPQGTVAIDWGVYGIPETFIIDKEGKIAFKHIGPLTTKLVKTKLLPLIEQLKQKGPS